MTDLSDLNEQLEQLAPSDPRAVGSTYGRTDWDNGRRLALYEGVDLRYCNDSDEWYRWDNDRWREATRGDQIGAAARTALNIGHEAMHIADDDQRGEHVRFAQLSLSERALRAMVNTATGVEEIRVQARQFDAARQWMNLPNCTLDPLTLEWHPHRREDFITKMCATPWDPNARSDMLNDFIARFLPDKEEREYLLQLLAVSVLSWGNLSRRLVLILGPTSTGKSTLTDLVMSTLGDDYAASANSSIFRGNLDDKPRPDLLRINGTRIVVANEASDHWELHPDQIKRMTGGDRITARGMRSDYMQENVASYVPIIVANTLPRIHGADDALRRRLTCCLMDASIPEDEDDGAARLRLVHDERSRRALLALLIRTYHECEGKVQLLQPLRFAELTMEMFGHLDDVEEILTALKDEGSLLPLPEGAGQYQSVRMSVLFKCYATWLKNNGTPQMKREQLGPKVFSQRLKSLGYSMIRSDGIRLMGWCLGDTSTTNVARF